ncbi:hypothetical protein CR513_53928, partial [Mucuna pruriens]
MQIVLKKTTRYTSLNLYLVLSPFSSSFPMFVMVGLLFRLWKYMHHALIQMLGLIIWHIQQHFISCMHHIFYGFVYLKEGTELKNGCLVKRKK